MESSGEALLATSSASAITAITAAKIDGRKFQHIRIKTGNQAAGAVSIDGGANFHIEIPAVAGGYDRSLDGVSVTDAVKVKRTTSTDVTGIKIEVW